MADLHDEDAAPIRAQMLNLSPGGMRLFFAAPVETGSILEVRPVSAPARLGWVAVEVKNCRGTEQGWELGCQFVEKPGLGMLLLFG